jgi:hypothetical protein
MRGGANKPLNNNIPVKEGKYSLKSGKRKKIANVIVPNDQKVIIEGSENQVHFPELRITFGSKGHFQIFKRNSGFDGHGTHL